MDKFRFFILSLILFIKALLPFKEETKGSSKWIIQFVKTIKNYTKIKRYLARRPKYIKKIIDVANVKKATFCG